MFKMLGDWGGNNRIPIFFLEIRLRKYEKKTNKQSKREQHPPIPPPFPRYNVCPWESSALSKWNYVYKEMRNNLLTFCIHACKVELKACYKWSF